jgi:chromosome segregation ATPase
MTDIQAELDTLRARISSLEGRIYLKLKEEFSFELAALKAMAASLEGRIANLENVIRAHASSIHTIEDDLYSPGEPGESVDAAPLPGGDSTAATGLLCGS